MTAEEYEPEQPNWHRPRRWPFVVLGLAVLFVLTLGWAGAYANGVWFNSVGYGDVYGTLATTKASLFLVAALLTCATMTATILMASRRRPREIEPGSWVARYRAYAEPVRTWIWIGLTTVASLALGAAETGRWRDLLLWWHGGSFGQEDPWFHHDIGFYVFTLPWWHDVVDFGLTLGLLALATSVTAHYFYGGIEVTPSVRWSRAAQRQIALVAAVTLLFKSGDYWLSRYDAVHARGSYATGLAYVDQHATVPGREMLAYAALICAGLLLWHARSGRWRIPVTAVVLLFVSSVTLTLIWPAILQSSVVNPNPLAHERENLTASIAATRTAYGLDELSTAPLSDTATVTDVPLLDPTKVRTELQVNGAAAASPPEVDRYVVDGKSRPVLVSMAQHGGVPEMVAAYADARDRAGKDDLATAWAQNGAHQDLSGSVAGPLWMDPTLPTAVVPSGSAPGVPLTAMNRLAFALANGDLGLLGRHGTLTIRLDPLQRVAQIAPWLELDQHPYVALVGGRALWVIDGYTTTGNYPGSAADSWATMTGDGSPTQAGSYNDVNYIRNAVKATVDAQDGTVRLYEWDADPILQAWEGILPGVVRAKAEIPPDLLPHLRYPTDLFAIQRFRAQTYTTLTPESLLEGQRTQIPTSGDGTAWAAPQRSLVDGVWSVASPMTASNGHDLAAVLVANSDATSPDYGRLSWLTPTAAAGSPATVNVIMRADPRVRAAIASLPSSATAQWGPLVLAAAAKTPVWAAPLYAVSTDPAKPPVLIDVVVSVGEVVGIAPTLPEAMAAAAASAANRVPTAAALMQDATALLAASQDPSLLPKDRDALVREAQAKLYAASSVLGSQK